MKFYKSIYKVKRPNLKKQSKEIKLVGENTEQTSDIDYNGKTK